MRRAPALPAPRALLLARRAAAGVRAAVLHAGGAAGGHGPRPARRLRPRSPPAADQDRLQPRPVRAGGGDGRRGDPRRGRPRHRADARARGRRPRRHLPRGDGHGLPDQRGDLAVRAAARAAGHARDVRHGPRRDRHQHVARARRGAGADRRAVGPDPAGDPGAHRLRRLPRLHGRAPAPRAAGVPLRGQPHAVALPGGRRRVRGPARPGARGVPGRGGGARALQRRADPAADHAVGERRARADAADRPRRGRRARRRGRRRPRAHRGRRLRRPAGGRLPRVARDHRRHGRRARRGRPRGRRVRDRQPLRRRRGLPRGRRQAARDARGARERRRPERPPRAGHLGAARAPGPPPARGLPRLAHRAAQPRAVPRARAPRPPRGRGRVRRAVHRRRRLQDRQRQPRPRRRRRAAARRRAPALGVRARRRPRGPARRRRVRRAAGRVARRDPPSPGGWRAGSSTPSGCR